MQTKKFFKSTTTVLLAFFAISVAVFLQNAKASDADEVHLTIIHLNDVYEITPVSGGTQGGIARVATLKKQLLAENPNTYITLSGDIYGPSGLSNAAIVNGKPLAGEHVVAVLNKVGINAFTFGDHEFDQFSAEQVLQRFKETTFPIISSNYADAEGKPFQQSDATGATIDIPKNVIFTVKNAAGTVSVRVGIFGVTEPFRSSDLEVTYTDWETAITEQVAELTGGDNPVDLLIAMTHFEVDTDKEIATKFPQIDLILGGDDHEHMKVEPGAGLAPIYKSDSNARNNYIIDLYYDTATGELRIEDRVQAITDAIADDPEVLAEVDKWLKIGFDALRQQGIQPERLVALAPFDLDGFATSIRNQQTELTMLILRGINNVVNADLSLLYSGFLRLDDLIPAGGEVTEYDVIRAFPSDDDIVSVKMLGSTLLSLLDDGQAMQGGGSFLLFTDDVTRDNADTWLLNDEAIDPNRTYLVGVRKNLADDLQAFDMLVAFDDGQFIKASETTIRQVMIDKIAKGCAATYYPESGRVEIPCIEINGVTKLLFKALMVPQSDESLLFSATRIKEVGKDQQ
jgi:5'-nucleotidase